MLQQSCGRCGRRVYFDNWSCLNCGSRLGLLPDLMHLAALDPLTDNITWVATSDRDGPRYRLCMNSQQPGICSGVLPADDPGSLCRACEFTEQIPALASNHHVEYWRRLERAKRRLLFTLADLRLTLEPRSRDPQNGLAFAFGADIAPGHRFLTGHFDGVISINIAEADDVERERTRTAMGEPYRTLLGHFRHESGHYYMHRLVDTPESAALLADVFGDVHHGYDDALATYYACGPRPDWNDHYISAYATAHPQEDWAETWAHYLLILDTLQSAEQAGVDPRNAIGETARRPTIASSVGLAADAECDVFDRALQRWLPLAEFANELARSLGTPDAYPFVLTDGVRVKLAAIDRLVQTHRIRTGGLPAGNRSEARHLRADGAT